MAENVKVGVDVEVNDPQNILTVKSGWRTTEFWIAVGMMLIGAWLIEKGHEEMGAALVTASGMGYQGSRTLVKRNRRTVGAFILAAFLFTGCHTGCLQVENVAPAMRAVIVRHDRYVIEDRDLDDAKRESQLMTTELLRRAIAEAEATEEAPQ